jgi:hypothetical protein
MRSGESALKIYQEGANALPWTLQTLSKSAELRWSTSPMYNLYKHAFFLGHDTLRLFNPATEYADILVSSLFDLENGRIIAAEGVVVFPVLMAYQIIISLQLLKNS